jgi:hypothetical protein
VSVFAPWVWVNLHRTVGFHGDLDLRVHNLRLFGTYDR